MSNEDIVVGWSWQDKRWVSPPLCLVEDARKPVTQAALSSMRSLPHFSLNTTCDWRNIEWLLFDVTYKSKMIGLTQSWSSPFPDRPCYLYID